MGLLSECLSRLGGLQPGGRCYLNEVEQIDLAFTGLDSSNQVIRPLQFRLIPIWDYTCALPPPGVRH